MEENDISLIKRILKGEKKVYEIIVKRHMQRVYFIALGFVGNQEDALDLSQEAFIKACESINSFREKSSFSTWLYRIVVNITINHLKRIGKRQTFTLDENISFKDSDLASMNDPEKVAEERELHEEITKAMESLPLEQKTVVVLAILEGLPHKEIAGILGCPEKTVSWRLFQARKKLREKLAIYVGGENQ